MDGTAHPVGPYSKPNVLAKLDGRRREARLLQKVRDDLTLQLGGNLTATEAAMIERCAWLQLHIALLDARLIESNADLSERDSRTYLGWANSLSRCLKALNIKPQVAKAPTLADYLATRAEKASEPAESAA